MFSPTNARALGQKDLYTHELKKFSKEELDYIIASYDGQVAAMDAALGELVGALKARGRYENALVIVTADHGEMLGEHDTVGHMGRMLYERFFEICREAGRGCVRCVTSPGNTLSIGFHAAMGFEVDPGTEPAGALMAKTDYDGPGVHRVAFVRALALRA